MQGMLRKQISRLEWLCAIGFFFLYLYIHASIILRLGMSSDEILDFNGSEMASHVYLSCGRWGLVVWGKLVGTGFLPVSGGVTAGLILTIAYLCQCRLLLFRLLKDKVLYGVISLACFQFYSVQVYSMQVEGFALGILLATLSCSVLMGGGLKCAWRVFFCTLLLFCSLSFYQTCGIYFVVLYGLALVARFRQGEAIHIGRHGMVLGIVCMGALIAFMGTKMALLHSGFLNSEAMNLCREHEKWTLTNLRFATNASEVVDMLKENMGKVTSAILFYNSRMDIFWGGCSVFLLIRIFQKIGKDIERIKWLVIYVVTLAFPLMFYTCFLSGSFHSYLFLPLLEAGTCTLALQEIKFPRWGNMLLALFLGIACIKASHSVSLAAARERACFEAKDVEHKLQYTEACRYALSHGMNPEDMRILVVEDGWNSRSPDYYAQYPIYPNFHLATRKDREKHAALIQKMTSWPAEGSIAESQGEIIINAQ